MISLHNCLQIYFSFQLDANPRVTREIVRQDEYEMVELLVTYYQMV